MTEKPQNFWVSLPGILTGTAAIITALTGLYIAISNSSSDDVQVGEPTDDFTDEVLDGNGSSGGHGITQPDEKPGQSNTGSASPLVDCTQFSTVNTVTTLMGWSDHYQQKIINARGNSVNEACNKTIEYRAMAHCKEQDNLQVRQALFETLQLCREAGIDWRQIKK